MLPSYPGSGCAERYVTPKSSCNKQMRSISYNNNNNNNNNNNILKLLPSFNPATDAPICGNIRLASSLSTNHHYMRLISGE